MANFTKLWNEYALEEHGLPIAQPTSWEWFIEAHGQAGKRAYKMFMEDESVIARWWPKMEEIPGAIKTLHRIADSGVQIVFVTHRRPVLMDVTRNWLDDRGLYQQCIHAGPEKHAWVDADFWLDDNVDVIKGLIEEKHKNAYLFDQPWNRVTRYAPGNRLPRLGDWDEVAEAIDWCIT